MDKIDLTNCDKEPIHIPGKIQSHGFLIAVNTTSFEISYASENVKEYFDVEIGQLLNKHISTFNSLLKQKEVDLLQLLNLGKSQDNFNVLNPYKLIINDRPFYLIIHQSEDNYVLEFETLTLEYDIQNIIGKSVSEILTNKSLQSLLNKAALEVKNMIGYDRVMIYKFQEDGHGEVVAEVKNDDLDPFLGLHYPASDIPKQARELYKLNITRIIADVNSTSSAIGTFSSKPLDLTHATLRAVSPIHIQYLKNMGVQSSYSISLLSEGNLWGLIACHNYSPKFIDFRAREGTKLIGQILSSALEYKQLEEDNEQSALLDNAVQELSILLDKDPDLISALTTHKSTLLDVTQATGVAIVFEDKCYTLGVTPDQDQLTDLFKWLKLTMNESIYHTTKLSAVYKPAKQFAENASGILACILSKDMGELIVWFKPEQIQAINWAGNPEKPLEQAEDGTMNLSPRNSFASWAEIVKNTSNKWLQAEISGVVKLRERIINTINKKTNAIRILNERLKLAYEELDTFSYTISHDLRTPLTSIKSYAELFLSKYKDIDEQGKNLLNRVIFGADKMGYLINEILKLARVGRSEVEVVKIDISSLVDEILTEIKTALKIDNIVVNLGNLPAINGDMVLVSQVFSNIIGNAVKYSSKNPNPVISITSKANSDEIIYSIKDNGIGIDANYHDKVFELFKRMENVKDFEGTGVGLAIVKRIMDRHNGRVWFESELGVGSTFYLAFKK